MGISSDGILVFGFEVGGEDEEPEFLLSEQLDFDDFVFTRAGLSDDASWDAQSKVLEACPADLVLHCSYECRMYILAVRGTEVTARRGYPGEITAEHMAVSPERIVAFKSWCEENGITYQEPKWLLCSMYG